MSNYRKCEFYNGYQLFSNNKELTVCVISKLMHMEAMFSRSKSSNFSTYNNLRIRFLTTKHTYSLFSPFLQPFLHVILS